MFNRTELDELKTDLEDLHDSVKKLHDISNLLHGAVMDGSNIQAKAFRGQAQQTDHLGNALKYFAILAGVSLIGMTYGLCIKQVKSKEKKFV